MNTFDGFLRRSSVAICLPSVDPLCARGFKHLCCFSAETSRREEFHRKQNGKGKDSHQHRGHWPCRFWQIYHHWTFDLQMRWNRQTNHREVRERSCRGN